MSRNGSGTMSIPNTFVSGNTITASGHNQNMSDIATELTNSVAADGQTSMTGPLKAANGTAAAPTLTFASDTDTGGYRSGANEYSVAAGGVQITKVSAAGLDIKSGGLLFAGVSGVTYANIQNVAASSLLGNPTGSAAAPSEITLGAGLSFAGTTLANSIIVEPQGYLTLTSNTPIIAGDVSAATSVYYTFLKGNLIPIYNGTSFVLTTFTELTLGLVSNHLASTIYDCFVVNDSGTIRLVTGPAWSSSAAGSGSRGTGAGTTELQRLNGLWTNKVSMTARYGASTTTVAANQGTYVGSIFINGTAGQVTCHTTYGQSRKWGVWNACNRVPIILKAGDNGTSTWTYNSATIRASNGSSANSMTVFQGLAESRMEFRFQQSIIAPGVSASPVIGVGYNSTTAISGFIGTVNTGAGGAVSGLSLGTGSYIAPPALGINVITSLEGGFSTSPTFTGLETGMLLTGQWMG